MPTESYLPKRVASVLAERNIPHGRLTLAPGCNNAAVTDHSQVWVKVSRVPQSRTLLREYQTLEWLQRNGEQVHVEALLYTRLDCSGAEMLVFPYRSNLFGAAPTKIFETAAQQLWGKARRVHRLPAPPFAKLDPTPTRRVFGVVRRRVEASKRFEVPSEVYASLSDVWGRVERYTRNVSPPGAPRVFSHGDIHLGNAAWDGYGNVAGLFDWESSHLTHPEWDLACLYRQIRSTSVEPDKVWAALKSLLPLFDEELFLAMFYLKSVSHASYLLMFEGFGSAQASATLDALDGVRADLLNGTARNVFPALFQQKAT